MSNLCLRAEIFSKWDSFLSSNGRNNDITSQLSRTSNINWTIIRKNKISWTAAKRCFLNKTLNLSRRSVLDLYLNSTEQTSWTSQAGIHVCFTQWRNTDTVGFLGFSLSAVLQTCLAAHLSIALISQRSHRRAQLQLLRVLSQNKISVFNTSLRPFVTHNTHWYIYAFIRLL